MTQAEQKLREAERLSNVKATAPYELLEVPGADALATWGRLKRQCRDVPIVIGDDESLLRVFNGFDSSPGETLPPIAKILEDASKLVFPDDLIKHQAREEAWANAIRQQRHSDAGARNDDRPISYEYEEPPGGEWPDDERQSPGLTVAMDWQSGKPLEKVYIALIPTKDWTEVPAYMRWGGWNACPQPEFHVAALRSWRDRYDVELVGMSFDVLNLLARRPPATREEALALAREQYAFCDDIIDQGVETFSALAADLMANDWWYFWWD